MVQLGGLEPPTSCSTDRRSNQLSYNCILGEAPQKRGSRMARKLGATPRFGKAASTSIARVKSPKKQKPGPIARAFADFSPIDQAAGL